MTASTSKASPSSSSLSPIQRRICVAPMLDWTDKNFRYFLRLISRHALLYTEMITTGALLHGDSDYHLDFDKAEHPLALQLGGSDPSALAACAKLATQYGYDEINLNCGCPSDRVQKGRFGACLMNEPALVARCIAAMKDAADMPVTLKHRIGVDNQTSHDELEAFVGTAKEAGCDAFIVHARNALLQGLSPKDNRNIPPLIYDTVYQLKRSFPDSEFIINGGITRIDEIQKHLEQVDGVMLGREAYHNPFLLAQMDGLFYGQCEPAKTRLDILEAFLPFAEQALARGVRLHHLSRHILGLFHGQPGARKFRRLISERAHREDAGIEVLLDAIALMSDYWTATETG
ncbi:MAG: tRNA dihydrouridine(20/20a) synthase DusA [Porticoccaceae bacterium]|nr:tRNA dihydrouridine(20/20a) synthase DusA [Porticoccaceae bacterium]